MVEIETELHISFLFQQKNSKYLSLLKFTTAKMMLVKIMGLDKCSYFLCNLVLKIGRTMLPNDEATQLHVPEQNRGDSRNHVRPEQASPFPY
jgi:hypothetical protein